MNRRPTLSESPRRGSSRASQTHGGRGHVAVAMAGWLLAAGPVCAATDVELAPASTPSSVQVEQRSSNLLESRESQDLNVRQQEMDLVLQQLPQSWLLDDDLRRKLYLQRIDSRFAQNPVQRRAEQYAKQSTSTCPGLMRAWSTAEGYAQRAQYADARHTLTRVLRDCPAAADRAATLYKVRSILGIKAAIQHTEQELQRSLPQPFKGELELWLYQLKVQHALLQYRKERYPQSAQELAPLVPEIRRRQDVGLARLLSDVYQRQGNYPKAIGWRKTAMNWSNAEREDREALAWLYAKQGNLVAARQEIAKLPAASQTDRKRLTAIQSNLASLAFNEGRYQEALAELARLQKKSGKPLGVQDQALRAWALYRLERYEEAQAQFAAVYPKAPTLSNAQGLFYSAAANRRLPELLSASQEAPGPLGVVANDPFVRQLQGEAVVVGKPPLYPSAVAKLIIDARLRLADITGGRMLTAANAGRVDAALGLAQQLKPWVEHVRHASYARSLSFVYEVAAGTGHEAGEAADADGRRYLQQVVYWRKRAIAWSEADNQDRLSLAWAGYRLGDQALLDAQLAALPADSAEARELHAALLSRQAADAFKAERYDASAEQLQRLSQLRALTPEESSLWGWALYRQDKFSRAFDQFSTAYEQRPADTELAKGLMFSAYQADRLGEVAQLAEQQPGALQGLFADAEVYEQALDGLARNEATIDGEAVLSLPPLEGSRLTATTGIRIASRSGDSGTSRLTTLHIPAAQVNWRPGRNSMLDGQLSVVQLNSGKPSANALIGSRTSVTTCPGGGAAPCAQPFAGKYDTLVTGFEPYLRYGHLLASGKRLRAGVGTTPTGGTLSPVLTGELVFAADYEGGGFELGLDRRAVTESLLSYVGQTDPYTGTVWGQVLETRLYGMHYGELAPGWHAAMEGGLGSLEGKRVETNHKLEFYGQVLHGIALAKGLDLDLGPELLVMVYEKNLGGFTLGHGGYFSPQSLIRIGAMARLEYEQPESLLLKARLHLGLQTEQSDCLENFTGIGSGCYENVGNSSGIASTLAVGALKRIGTSGHHMGLEFETSSSPAFNTWYLWLTWTYDFEAGALRPLYSRSIEGWNLQR